MFYPSKVKGKNIVCLESHWGGGVAEPRPSVKPILEFCSVARGNSLTHFIVHTKEELVYDINQIKRKNCNLLFLAFHGDPDKTYLGVGQEFVITLDELADILGKRFHGIGVHLSSCSVLNTSQESINSFLDKTGVLFLSGYAQGIDFIEGMVMDMAFLGKWFQYKRISSFEKSLKLSYRDFIKENKFRIYRNG